VAFRNDPAVVRSFGRDKGPQLAALSISLVIGMAVLAVTAYVLSTGVGAYGFPRDQLSGQGTSLLTVTPGSLATVADLDVIARATQADVPLTSRILSGADAVVTDTPPYVPVEGVDPSYAQVSNTTLARGAFFTASEATAANRVAVLGQNAASSLFPNGQQPIGQTIMIRHLPYTVVGVLSTELSPGTADANDAAMIPFQTAQVRVFGTQSTYGLLLQVRDASRAGTVSDEVRQLLRQRHNLTAGQPDAFAIRTDPMSSSDASQTAVQALQLAERYFCGAKALCSARSSA
jgi:ABC-type antimicrobial peptide transport system permease subunit